MPLVGFSQRDINRNKLVLPAWYLVRLEKFDEAISSKGDSTNYTAEGTILRNAEDGSEEFADVPIIWNFNSKAPGFLIGFLTVLGIDVSSKERYELNALAGKTFIQFVGNKEYEGRTMNDPQHKYQPVPQEVA